MGKCIDLTDKIFTKLKVLERDKEYEKNVKNSCAYWKCQCECGKIITVNGAALRSGHTKSCGCLQKEIASKNSIKDLTGKTFDNLKVIERDLTKPIGHQKKAYWICECKCGNKISVISDSLISGHTTSCGCAFKSKGERKIKEILSLLDINFKTQYSFKDLKGEKTFLRFDFAIFNKEKLICLIEYQGQQHYSYNSFLQTEKGYQKQIKYDEKKRQYCKDNKIKLIEIPYWEYSQIDENYIKEKINDEYIKLLL